ncbi:hypothetical protein M427DRAFT_56580 [Gonapodya prolifera JEL478]|uniref:Mitochondrial adapter protein MCP1 transmembrane domain-containing protein n=1 Tax=Gonapodya prolifera (strain JEL478) TaxID=1344416 RepID=A0A139AH37_GONPJ|nr:hypothetical protein M427DRAFT_56580 [Gonapodya prolifera JEL478]|eukprot:KXS15755.1 hypothetical protein M427DRAFT_56580 [Gonapodya prolifera JEL478]
MAASRTETNDGSSTTPSLDATLRRIQAATGIIFSTFTVVHLCSWLLLHAGSFDAATKAMNFFRAYYQNPLVEPTLAASAAAHVSVSAWRVLRRSPASNNATAKPSGGSQTSPTSPLVQDRLYHRYAGWILTALVPVHVFATRFNPYLALGAVESARIVGPHLASHVTVEQPGVFLVYYALLTTSGLFHTIAGLSYAFQALKIRLPFPLSSLVSPTSLRLRQILLTTLSISTVLALCGYYYPLTFTEEQEYAFHLLKNVQEVNGWRLVRLDWTPLGLLDGGWKRGSG